MKAKYIALCKKLNKQEMKEKLEEAQEITECEEIPDRESLKPVPDYERLQRDVQQSSLKVFLYSYLLFIEIFATVFKCHKKKWFFLWGWEACFYCRALIRLTMINSGVKLM